MGVAVLGAILSGIIGFYMATSRLLYSMSKERVLPAWFGRLGEHNTPKNAIIFTLAVFCKQLLEKVADKNGECCISKMEKVAGTFRSESFAF